MKTIQMILLVIIILHGAVTASAAHELLFEQDPALPAYQEAIRLVAGGSYTEAAVKFESIFSTYPDSVKAPRSMYYYAWCLEKLSQKHQAFKYYKLVSDRYKNSLADKRAVSRAVNLARNLRGKKGDSYDTYLTSYLDNNIHGKYRFQTALSMAEFGDWRGLEVLIEGLEQGGTFEQIRAMELLRRRIDNTEARGAIERALLHSRNEIVRMMSASAIATLGDRKPYRRILINAMLTDSNSLVRNTAVKSLNRFIQLKDVQEAFVEVLESEQDPVVLSTAIDSLSIKMDPKTMQGHIAARLGDESDPSVKFVLMGSLGGVVTISEEIEVVIKGEMENPDPSIRIKAIHILSVDRKDPQVRKVFVQKLESDPNISVRISAANALAGFAAYDNVRQALTLTVKSSDNIGLVTTSIRALRSQIHLHSVREGLVFTLKLHRPPFVQTMLVDALAPRVDDPFVLDAFFTVLETSENSGVKRVVLENISEISDDKQLARLEKLYRTEKDPSLVRLYLDLIGKIDAERAESLKNQK